MFVGVITLFFLLDRNGTALLALTVAIMHELGHLLWMTLFGRPPQNLSFHLFGIRLKQSATLLPPHQEALVLLAGSGVNFVTSGILLLFLPPAPTRDLFAMMHLSIGVINLLPMRGLDGGALLELALTQHLPLWQSERILSLVQWIVLLTVTGLAGYALFCFQVSITLLFLVAYLWLSLLRA